MYLRRFPAKSKQNNGLVRLCGKYGKCLVVWSRHKNKNEKESESRQSAAYFYQQEENRLNIKPSHQPVSQHSHRKPFWVYRIQTVTPFLQESVQTNKRGQCCVLFPHALLPTSSFYNKNLFSFMYYSGWSFIIFFIFLPSVFNSYAVLKSKATHHIPDFL